MTCAYGLLAIEGLEVRTSLHSMSLTKPAAASILDCCGMIRRYYGKWTSSLVKYLLDAAAADVLQKRGSIYARGGGGLYQTIWKLPCGSAPRDSLSTQSLSLAPSQARCAETRRYFPHSKAFCVCSAHSYVESMGYQTSCSIHPPSWIRKNQDNPSIRS